MPQCKMDHVQHQWHVCLTFCERFCVFDVVMHFWVQKGYPPEMALQASNPIRMPPKLAKSDGNKIRLTSESVKSLKHDAAVLKQFSDLREVNATKSRGGGGFGSNTEERRDARRELRKLAKVKC